VTAGTRVVLEDGRHGTVVATLREPGCGCATLIVRLDSGREWAGHPREVRRA
jgi:hypothetical protein